MTDKGPGFQPIAGIAPSSPQVSLLSVSRRLPAGTDWLSGISWRSSAPLVGHRRAFCDSDTDNEDAAALTQPKFYPYTVYVPYACDWVTDPEQYRAEAIAAGEAVTAWNMARELWTAETDTDNPSLMSSASDVSAAGAVHPVTAVGTLLEAYENCAQSGGAVLHIPTAAVVSLIAHGVVKQNGDIYYGPNGSVVSPGPGYPTDASGTGPAAADAGAGNVWSYVTGPVEFDTTPVEVPLTNDEAYFDRRRNRYEVTAQRMVIHRFDPTCVFAVKTYVPSPGQGETP